MYVRCSFVVPYFVEGLPGGGKRAGGCDAENTRAQQRDEKRERRSDVSRMDIVNVAQNAVSVSTLLQGKKQASQLLAPGIILWFS
jgi:hypothetical protein